MGVALVDAVGERIANLWDNDGTQGGTFSCCATEALREARLADHLTVESLLAELACTRQLPEQFAPHSTFGQPPVTLFRRPDFLIDVYFWLGPHTDIHSHSFSGAFTVLEGRSLHVAHCFEGPSPEGSPSLGRLRCDQVELLRSGDVREIQQDTRLIHQVWHLSQPSISLVARTRSDRPGGHIWHYEAPGICVDSPRTLSETGARKLQLISLHARLGRPLEGFLKAAVDSDDDTHAFWYLRAGFEHTRSVALLRTVIDGGRLAGLSWAEALHDSLAGAPWAHTDLARVADQDGRFVLSVLLSVDDPKRIRSLVAQYAPDRPVGASMVDWLRQLSRQGAINLALNDTAALVLESRIEGDDSAQTARRLAEQYQTDVTGGLDLDVQECLAAMQAHPLLEKLLA